MTPDLIQILPPKLLIEQYNKIQGTDTPLDRIELHGRYFHLHEKRLIQA